MLEQKSIIDRPHGWLQMGGDSGTCFVTWSVCLPYSHHWRVLHVEHNLFQVNLQSATVHYFLSLSFNVTLRHWHELRKKTPPQTSQTFALLDNTNSSVAESKMSAVATMVRGGVVGADWLQPLLQHPWAMRWHHSAVWYWKRVNDLGD